MRLSDVLSNPPSNKFEQIEGFVVNKRMKCGSSTKISVGKIALNYFCKECGDVRTFYSGEELYCIGVNKNIISVDSVLECPRCGALVQVWFLLESENEITSKFPSIHILKKSEKLSEKVLLNEKQYGDFTELLEKSKRAARDQLGAGAIVYLRKILERVTHQAADAEGIPWKKDNGKPKPFKEVLEVVDSQCSIIPREFSENGYKLFGELSDVVHGDYSEETALLKFDALYRLVIGVIENVKNNKEMMDAIGKLGWNGGERSE